MLDVVALCRELDGLGEVDQCAALFKRAILSLGFNAYACGEIDLAYRDVNAFFIIDWPRVLDEVLPRIRFCARHLRGHRASTRRYRASAAACRDPRRLESPAPSRSASSPRDKCTPILFFRGWLTQGRDR